jgi:tetratricopeptide (TPR) repeat protein
LITAISASASPTPLSEPTGETRANQYIRDLGSPLYQERARATNALWKMGERARPALNEAARSDDPEVAHRAQEILDRFDWGIYPDTSPGISRQIRAFRTGDPTTQQSAITALIRLGEPGVPVLRLLLAKEFVGDYRHALFEHLCWVLRREVPKLLYTGRHDQAEALLALHTLGSYDPGLADYSVFLTLRGRARTAAIELEAARSYGGKPAAATARSLVYLYRAAGEVDKARMLATAIEKDDPAFSNTHESLLEDLAAWDALASRTTDARANSRDGLLAFRLRLAGRSLEAEELIIRQLKDDLTETSRSGGVDAATLALMLNDRPLDGIERLRVRGNAPHILADVLSARLDFREALDLVGEDRMAESTEQNTSYLQHLSGSRRGRLLWQVGRREDAAVAFEQVAGRIGSDSNALTHLIRAEVRTGRHDLACEHLGRAVAAAEYDGGRISSGIRQDGFEVLFEADADAAAHWWRVLRQTKPKNEAPGATMRRVRSLVTGTASPLEVSSALQAIETTATDYADAPTRALAEAVVLRAVGRTADAAEALARVADRFPTPTEADLDDDDQARRYGRGTRSWVFGTDERFRFWMELGDLLTEVGRHREAAVRLEQGWQRFPDNPVLLYLSGKALIRAGEEQEGRQRTELAHWVALGNARLRGRFLEELTNRGQAADLRRERDLVREAGWVSELYLGNVWNQMARASVVLKDFDAAASANRRAIHYILRTPGVTYVEGNAYLSVPLSVRVNQARALLAAGKVEQALALAHECLVVMPGHSELVIGLVPELDRIGRTKDADELFRRVWDTFGSLLREYPQSGWIRYSAAWLAAGCRRELAAGLDHAIRAAELEPGMKSYREALAEVRFRRGEREQAVAIMTELSQSDRRNHFYQRQLERYRSGNLTSPLPDAALE